jgi:hypothetical protein
MRYSLVKQYLADRKFCADRIPARKSSGSDESMLSAQGISGRKAGILPANDTGNVTSN